MTERYSGIDRQSVSTWEAFKAEIDDKLKSLVDAALVAADGRDRFVVEGHLKELVKEAQALLKEIHQVGRS